jgi:hypothetical protein
MKNDALFYGLLATGGLAASVAVYFLVRRYAVVGAVEFQGQRWPITDEDKLWLGRLVIGESGLNATRQEGAAVLWSIAQRRATLPGMQGRRFVDVIRGFSQPLSPLWDDPNADRCLQYPEHCTASRIERRRVVSSTSWSALPAQVRQLVEDFVGGRVPNPIPGYNNFATVELASRRQSELPLVAVGGNGFIRDPGSLQGEVRIV